MFQPATALGIDANQEKRLTFLAGSGKTPQKIALRARLVLLAAEGIANQAIAARLGISRPTVLLWRSRFQRSGVPGLMKDARRPGRKKAVAPEVVQRVVEATLHTTPPAATHWTIRTMARTQGLSRMTVQRIWKQDGLQLSFSALAAPTDSKSSLLKFVQRVARLNTARSTSPTSPTCKPLPISR